MKSFNSYFSISSSLTIEKPPTFEWLFPVKTDTINLNGIMPAFYLFFQELKSIEPSYNNQPIKLENLVITSGRDGRHSQTSAHYFGSALDISCRGDGSNLMRWLCTTDGNNLLKKYKLMTVEPVHGSGAHIHLEFVGSYIGHQSYFTYKVSQKSLKASDITNQEYYKLRSQYESGFGSISIGHPKDTQVLAENRKRYIDHSKISNTEHSQNRLNVFESTNNPFGDYKRDSKDLSNRENMLSFIGNPNGSPPPRLTKHYDAGIRLDDMSITPIEEH